MLHEPAHRAYPAFAEKLLEQHRNIERVLILIRLQVDSLHSLNDARDLRLIDRAVVYLGQFPALVHDPSEEFLYTKLVERSPTYAPLCARLSRQQTLFSTLNLNLLEHLKRAQGGDDRAYKMVKESGITYCSQYADHIHVEEADLLPSTRRRLTHEDWACVSRQAGDAFGADDCPELKTHDSLYDFLIGGKQSYRRLNCLFITSSCRTLSSMLSRTLPGR